MPPDPPSLTCLCMHTYTSDTHVTPLLKILATGLHPFHFFCKVNFTYVHLQIWRFWLCTWQNVFTANVPLSLPPRPLGSLYAWTVLCRSTDFLIANPYISPHIPVGMHYFHEHIWGLRKYCLSIPLLLDVLPTLQFLQSCLLQANGQALELIDLTLPTEMNQSCWTMVTENWAFFRSIDTIQPLVVRGLLEDELLPSS